MAQAYAFLCLPNIINAMYIEFLTEVILPTVQNIVGYHYHLPLSYFYAGNTS
jgi:hypothetical protein